MLRQLYRRHDLVRSTGTDVMKKWNCKHWKPKVAIPDSKGVSCQIQCTRTGRDGITVKGSGGNISCCIYSGI